jgi:predicted dehydrogenase
MGMAGGGEGAFIGAIHRAAARLDGEIELVCGAFSSNPDISRRTGAGLGLPPERVYESWQEMLTRERQLPEHVRAEFISIVTPNDLHFPIASRALEAGFHVLSDKPATCTLAEAQKLADIVTRVGNCYALTHTYLGYPMVVEARARIAAGAIGAIRRISVEYAQGWLAGNPESEGNRQAQWRTDPQRAGLGGCVADIGVHAFNLLEYISGRQVVQLCADLATITPTRRLDDQAAAFLRFDNGAHGTLAASQISTGEENDLTIGVYGETGGIVWAHRDANSLRLLNLDGTEHLLRAGSNIAALDPSARALCRTPAGHPEGFIEAFANLYRAFAADVRNASRGSGVTPASPAGTPAPAASLTPATTLTPAAALPAAATLVSPAPIGAAVRGMAFIEAMVRSSAAGQSWVALENLEYGG